MFLRALWQLRFGRKPCDESRKTFSNKGSKKIRSAFCTILSFVDGIPSGFILPLAFGINILLVGLGEYFLQRSSTLKEIIAARVVFSTGMLLTPIALLPLSAL